MEKLSFHIKDVIFKRMDCNVAFNLPKRNDFVYLNPPYLKDNYITCADSFEPYIHEKAVSWMFAPVVFTSAKQDYVFSATHNLQLRNVLFLLHTFKTDSVTNFFKNFSIEEHIINKLSKNPVMVFVIYLEV